MPAAIEIIFVILFRKNTGRNGGSLSHAGRQPAFVNVAAAARTEDPAPIHREGALTLVSKRPATLTA